jgi:rhamnogalacturonyl hydrolase YesR
MKKPALAYTIFALFLYCLQNSVVASISESGLEPGSVPTPGASTARVIPIPGTAWAGAATSEGRAVYTNGVIQYAGFYDADGVMVLAKRQLGEDTWETRKTGLRGPVKKVSGRINLVADGDGYLHVVWGPQGNSLHYARSIAPGSLELGIWMMAGRDDSKAINPRFFRLPDGGLLLFYCDSGSNRIVLNYYDLTKREWRRRQEALIDGDDGRAYADMTLDVNNVLHLTWVWRENQDPATNHDIAYARSYDGGITWQRSDGSLYKLPITAVTAEYAAYIPQQHNLINQPAISADAKSRPFIAAYWSDTPEESPRFNVIYSVAGQWMRIRGEPFAGKFNSSGAGDKRAPWSRPALLLGRGARFHLVYRDTVLGGRMIAASVLDLKKPVWERRLLTSMSVDEWEASIDPEQWARLGHAQFLLQYVDQRDSKGGAEPKAASIGLLDWSPNWERQQPDASHVAPLPAKVANPKLAPALDAATILPLAEKVARWQWEHMPASENYHPRAWTLAPFYLGSLEVGALRPESGLEARVMQQAQANAWQPNEQIYDADDHAVMQVYLRLYLKYKDSKMVAPSKARLDYILKHPSPAALDWGRHDSRDRWSWCDALFMAPMSWLLMYEATGQDAYLDFMNHEWWATTERLYRPEVGLYFRDETYFDLREHNGKTVHWARGNGWVIAGLAQILDHFPKTHSDYPRYLKLFQEMTSALLAAQQPDGLWRVGLLDPASYNARETSGSSLITFAFAWGLNKGLLDRKQYLPATARAWQALAQSITAEGKLQDVQPVGQAPNGFDSANSEPFATGAFLLAASEMYKLAKLPSH